MKDVSPPFRETWRNFRPLKPYFLQNLWALLVGLLCLLAVDFLQLLIPRVIKHAVDLLTMGSVTSSPLFRLSGLIVAIAVVMACFRYVWRHLIFGHARKVEEALRSRLYDHLQTLSLGYYQRSKTGDLMARAVNDINGVRMATGMGLVALTDGLVLGMAAIGFMMAINVRLTVLSLIPAPVIVVLTKILTKRMSAGFESVQNTFSDLTERVREAFSGIRVIKSFDREAWAAGRVADEGTRYVSENMKLAKTLAFFFPMMTILTNAGLAIVIGIGGRQTILGIITTGDFVAFISYLNLLTWPMMAMGWVANLIQRGAASMRRINTVLAEMPEIRDAAAAVEGPSAIGGIALRNVHVRYPGQKEYALRDITLEVGQGETLAIVGPVGCGKTTLLRLIPRLIDPTGGGIFINGHNIREVPLRPLRENIGFVTQEIFLFSETIRENVAFGRKDGTTEELLGLLESAGLLEEIQDLEKGLDTFLGERGISLSGGQRQRLTIARALLSDPAVLILDDALSMVDTRTEEKILNQILEKRQAQTNLIVSHRVSTIQRAPRIVVLDNGRVVEEGSHEELLALGGLYAGLYERQVLSDQLEGDERPPD